MINFTNAVEEFNTYSGSEKKKTLIYDNNKYLVKFPDPVRQKNKNISYINNAFSEYIGSNVFKMAGFNTQNVVLGIYNYNGKDKIVCGCTDFTDNNHILCEFENLALSSNPDKKIETEISDIMEVLEENSHLINVKETKDKFWDMFIIDSLIGNTDRHNGNWGFLLNKENKELTFAPIYDCGSSLNPILDDEEMKSITNTELKNLAINCYSCLRVNNNKINYMSYIKEMKNIDCNSALKRVYSNIDINEINSFIDNIECISNYRKEFYKNIINIRYNILKNTYEKLG